MPFTLRVHSFGLLADLGTSLFSPLVIYTSPPILIPSCRVSLSSSYSIHSHSYTGIVWIILLTNLSPSFQGSFGITSNPPNKPSFGPYLSGPTVPSKLAGLLTYITFPELSS